MRVSKFEKAYAIFRIVFMLIASLIGVLLVLRMIVSLYA